MRKIEKEMIEAAKSGKNWSKDNTSVIAIVGGMLVQLHGNDIGVYEDQGGGHFGFTVDVGTLKKWPTNTTKSRIRAFGVDLVQKKNKMYIDGKEV